MGDGEQVLAHTIHCPLKGEGRVQNRGSSGGFGGGFLVATCPGARVHLPVVPKRGPGQGLQVKEGGSRLPGQPPRRGL